MSLDKWSLHDWLFGLDDNIKKPEIVTKRYITAKLSRIGISTYDTIVNVDTIPEGRIEWLLWYKGKCMIWRSKTLGWVVSDCIETGYDVNGFANRWRPEFGKPIPEVETPEMTELDDCVVIYDTLDPMLRRSIALTWASDYADTTETIRQQVFNQKTPMLAICGGDRQRNKLANLMVKIAENFKVIFVEKGLKDDIETLDFNAPFNVESLCAYRKALESEMLEFMGVDSQDAYQKKERLIVDEQEGNDELLNYLLYSGLKSREIAVEKLKSKGLDASTRIIESVRPMQLMEEGELNDTENETV